MKGPPAACRSRICRLGTLLFGRLMAPNRSRTGFLHARIVLRQEAAGLACRQRTAGQTGRTQLCTLSRSLTWSSPTDTSSQLDSCSAFWASVTPPPLVRKQTGYFGSTPAVRGACCLALCMGAMLSAHGGVYRLICRALPEPFWLLAAHSHRGSGHHQCQSRKLGVCLLSSLCSDCAAGHCAILLMRHLVQSGMTEQRALTGAGTPAKDLLSGDACLLEGY